MESVMASCDCPFVETAVEAVKGSDANLQQRPRAGDRRGALKNQVQHFWEKMLHLVIETAPCAMASPDVATLACSPLFWRVGRSE
jgi:hypothetical protein